ncbi:MAG TPA: peptidylprolyl isomerase [Rhodopila sp.]|nr:peptidylprolyl isomerase [Rhodopila sp.]
MLACAAGFPMVAWAQPVATEPAGVPPPTAAAAASLDAALAELDRSADTIAAEVGSRAITWADVADRIRAMPEVVSAIAFPDLYKQAALQLMHEAALAAYGRSLHIDKDAATRRRLAVAIDKALADEVLRRSLAPNVSDQSLHQLYNAYVANKPGPDEVRARLIMVDTQDKADELIKRLQAGASFADLARAFSQDGTARNGGDLGFARLDMLTPELGAVMFALAPGQMTQYPVRSNNRWFIIRVEERRQPPAPAFDAIKRVLERDVIRAGVPQLLQAAEKVTPVRYYGLTGKEPAASPTN